MAIPRELAAIPRELAAIPREVAAIPREVDVSRRSRPGERTLTTVIEQPVIPAPSRHSVEKARIALHRRLGGSKVLTLEESCEAYARDDSEAVGRTPDVVVRAECRADILATLAVAQDCGIPVTPRAAGTGRTGGAVPMGGGIVLSVLGMNQIKEVDTREGIAVVEPGVVLEDLHSAAESLGWFYPPDPNSKKSCTLAGNVAENAGGPRAHKYGVTRDWVLGLEAFTLGGQRLLTGRRTRKGVTGYDICGLLVGSEGTLAVFGDITLRLMPRPEQISTLLVLLTDLPQACRVVESITASGLQARCLELLDRATLQALRAAGNPVDERAGALLLIEVDGSEHECEVQAARIAGLAEDEGVLDLLVAQDAGARERLWSARREMSHAVRRMARHKLSEDVVVPRQRLGELLRRVKQTSEEARVRSLAYGHAGDGNMHVNFIWDEPDERVRVQTAIEQLFRDTVELGGTLSGEHGIGVMKAPYLGIEQSPELIALQRNLKGVFDPAGLLNPGKIFPRVGHGVC